jgi:lipopolysaccharide biosynthesis protein
VPIWPGVMPGWDNTARMPRVGHVFHGSTPKLFGQWLDYAIVRARLNPPGERFVMINAWNEWAEGAYLEPDRRFGYAYLQACASAIEQHSLAAVSNNIRRAAIPKQPQVATGAARS